MMSGTKKARAENDLVMSQGTQRTASLLVSLWQIQLAYFSQHVQHVCQWLIEVCHASC